MQDCLSRESQGRKKMVAKYSIKDLEKLSGIKAHTIRIWEQRYNLLSPERTETNIRWYTNEDLKMLLNVSMLYHRGYKISKIAALPKARIIEEVNKLSESQTTHENQIDNLVISMVEMDETKFEKIISSNILRIGFSQTIDLVIYPFLKKIGILWQTGSINPAQEHFISNLIRQKIIVAIDGLIPANPIREEKVVLFLPDGELHELSLLYYSYLLKAAGYRMIYLGQSVPYEDLKRVFEIHQPKLLLSVLTQQTRTTEKFLRAVSADFSSATIFLSGALVVNRKEKFGANVIVFQDAADLMKRLQ